MTGLSGKAPVSRSLLALLLLMVLVQDRALAHETRPAYLEITQTGEREYRFTFRQPQIQGRYLGLAVTSECRVQGEEGRQMTTAALETSWTAMCEADLMGSGVRIAGLESTLIDTLVHIVFLDGDEMNVVLTPQEPVLELSGGGVAYLPAYLVFGVEHLVFGIDHVAFLLVLMYLLRDLKKLVIAITSFTVAHSVTLGLSAFGLVFVPQKPVEAIIALSILVVAYELTRPREGSLINDYPWSLAFVFGLLHGLGFAGAMAEIGLPESSALMALLLFNLGIEAGQLLVMALAGTLVFLWQRSGVQGRELLGRLVYFAPVYLIGGMACYWFIDRTLGILFAA